MRPTTKQAKQARHREYMRRRYREDPAFKEAHIARVRANDKRYRREVVRLIAEFRANGCALCDETESCCLTAHHLDPSKKEFEVGGAISKRISPNRVRTELVKCVCLCANCHAKVHAGVVTLKTRSCSSTAERLLDTQEAVGATPTRTIRGET